MDEREIPRGAEQRVTVTRHGDVILFQPLGMLEEDKLRQRRVGSAIEDLIAAGFDDPPESFPEPPKISPKGDAQDRELDELIDRIEAVSVYVGRMEARLGERITGIANRMNRIAAAMREAGGE